MKILIVLSFVLLGSFALGEESPALAFPSAKIEVPPLSLVDGAKQGLPPIFGSASPLPGALARQAAGPRKVISRMPIVVPAGSVDAHMIKKPDDSIDYKMIVKAPDVESVK